MAQGLLEHINYTVANAERSAKKLCEIFDWKIRWRGQSIHNGTSVHVGTDDRYLALYTPSGHVNDAPDHYAIRGGLNHVGVLVEDLDLTEQRVIDAGYKTHSHQTYNPGSRFYFHNEDGIEFEVVSYREHTG